MANLCPRLREIADFIGEEQAILLSDLFGGTYLWIRLKNFPSTHNIHQLSGDAVAILQKEYGGQRIFIPKGRALRLEALRHSIVEDRKKGMSVSRVALKYKISDRKVYNLCGNSLATAI